MANYTPTFTTEERRRLLDQAASSHPLEMFPWFRRWPQSHARDLVYTFIWNTGFATIFAVFGIVTSGRLPSLHWMWINLVIANCVGYTLHLLFFLGGCTVERAIRDAGRVAVTLYYMALSSVGVVTGFWIATLLLGRVVSPQRSIGRAQRTFDVGIVRDEDLLGPERRRGFDSTGASTGHGLASPRIVVASA